jgi:Holliday junction DNA helicase RuvA
MIAKISGVYAGLSRRGVFIDVAGITCEVYLTSYTREHLQSQDVGDRISLPTVYYIESSMAGGYLSPVLIGFKDELEKEFFQMFTSVNSVGVKTALAAINMPVAAIARAIESSDVDTLKNLKGIGERTARKIIASLHGKVAGFSLVPDGVAGAESRREGKPEAGTGIMEEAVQVLLQLGYNMAEAKKMIKEAVPKNLQFQTAQEILEEIYKNRFTSLQKR